MQDIETLPPRIRQKIRVHENGYWEWTGATSTSGYGRIYWEGKVHEAHRVIYTLLVGPIPDGLVIDHLCHTAACSEVGRSCPHRRCENPADMRLVTRGVNALRSQSPPALNALKLACVQGHEYTEETLKIDAGTRRCLICRRETDKRRRPRGTPRAYRKATSKFQPKPNFPTSRA